MASVSEWDSDEEAPLCVAIQRRRSQITQHVNERPVQAEAAQTNVIEAKAVFAAGPRVADVDVEMREAEFDTLRDEDKAKEEVDEEEDYSDVTEDEGDKRSVLDTLKDIFFEEDDVLATSEEGQTFCSYCK